MRDWLRLPNLVEVTGQAGSDAMEPTIDKVRRLHERGQREQAVAMINQIIVENPLDEKAFRMRAFLFQAEGLFKAAIEDLDKAIALNPTDPQNYFNSAFGHLQLGNWKRVVADCTRALELGDEYIQSVLLFFRAEALISLGRRLEAKVDLQSASSEGPIWTNKLRTRSELLGMCE